MPARPSSGQSSAEGVEPLLDRLDRDPGEGRRGQRLGAVVPVGELRAELDEAAVDAGHLVDRVGVAVAELEHDVATPRLSGDGWAVELERVDEQGEVVGAGATS